MTDWKKLKVVELKEECKTRDIPLAGLKLKQHYIDKLEEYESNNASGRDPEAPADAPNEPAKENGSDGAEALNGDAPAEAEEAEKAEKAEKPAVQEEDSRAEGEADPGAPENDVRDDAPLPATASDQPAQKEPDEGKAEIGQDAEDKKEQKEGKDQPPNADSLTQTEATAASAEEPKDGQNASKGTPSPRTPRASTTPTPPTSMHDSTQMPPTELAEDQRKRKRRSATPDPTAEEGALKRARIEDDSPAITEKADDALPQTQEPTEATNARGGTDVQPKASDVLEPADNRGVGVDAPKEASSLPRPAEDSNIAKGDAGAQSDRESSPTPDVAPSIHPPTSSLYIRNFKRPLHIPTLKEHVANLAQSRADPDSRNIKSFYLDSIRSHAFISFTSPSAASRVRAAMHKTRFPDEPQREPLFVDYIPDDKVQDWIDQETGSGFGRGGNNKRFEVVYSRGPNGVEATLQDGESSRQRPSLPPSRNVLSNAPRAPAAGGGVHPDRAGFLLREDRKLPFPERPQKREAGETGFKALDELFSFTTTKPKLYYKPVAPQVVDDRLDMIKGLRVGHADMGRSGDEGMKRYTFEAIRGREEWVDKGPEFGHGQRGLAILRGERGRGRGGFRAGRGDSWRGR